MGLEPTPPYEEGGYNPARQGSYTQVPQIELDDIERQTPSSHQHGHAPAPTTSVVTTPHEHCETCEKAIVRRESKRADAYCCRMVALVFIVLFICLTLLGIVIAWSRRK
ncbi:hypothetical protein ASPWEDRAFT_174765 [Aspergillus wentii DTO 134E9]|uniref:Uncharacterized protein n=1 Tax=Aspergillus wentii DTO 134E9 TaxID=1073089 RepID=A0A1L9RER4_ASPWE|nr:uncharacterized protein ASPWEDRAFT_174765 [Aspergillus wentii DTO 134E9]KAI9933604.1 hypothetical protein MW887_008077 [Aspergillus wentii]OJJ33357.1 hypothetical protein ASPWEDRAFT_174765 [Aspergillus wentii DTO 134E9]